MKVRELLTDESKWTQKACARDAIGKVLTAIDRRSIGAAACWCTLGAMEVCYTKFTDWDSVRDRIVKSVGMSVSTWNDAPERTFADVRKLIEELDI